MMGRCATCLRTSHQFVDERPWPYVKNGHGRGPAEKGPSLAGLRIASRKSIVDSRKEGLSIDFLLAIIRRSRRGHRRNRMSVTMPAMESRKRARNGWQPYSANITTVRTVMRTIVAQVSTFQTWPLR